MIQVMRGERAPRPRAGHPRMPTLEPSDREWEVIQHCWDHNPAKRPSMEEVLRQLKARFSYPSSAHSSVSAPRNASHLRQLPFSLEHLSQPNSARSSISRHQSVSHSLRESLSPATRTSGDGLAGLDPQGDLDDEYVTAVLQPHLQEPDLGAELMAIVERGPRRMDDLLVLEHLPLRPRSAPGFISRPRRTTRRQSSSSEPGNRNQLALYGRGGPVEGQAASERQRDRYIESLLQHIADLRSRLPNPVGQVPLSRSPPVIATGPLLLEDASTAHRPSPSGPLPPGITGPASQADDRDDGDRKPSTGCFSKLSRLFCF
jgi:hypothetical protein